MTRAELVTEWRRLGRELSRAHMADDAHAFDRIGRRMDRVAAEIAQRDARRGPQRAPRREVRGKQAAR